MLKLSKLIARRYLSLRDVEIPLSPLNVFIGPNASGKSNILNALRFLMEGVRDQDFAQPVASRGGLLHLAWKGEPASEVELTTELGDEAMTFQWHVALARSAQPFELREKVQAWPLSGPPQLILEARNGAGWWWSEDTRSKVKLSVAPTACALAAASADQSFPGRRIADFVRGWGFFDPSPPLLRRSSASEESDRLDFSGRNLASRLRSLQGSRSEVFQRILQGARDILGVPETIEFRSSEEDGRTYFVQREPGLGYPVHQVGASSGTLRALALLTAICDPEGLRLVGIEEPENHVHPNALDGLAGYLKEASQRMQVLVTTHSPQLLSHLDSPDAVSTVRRGKDGTEVTRQEDPQAVRKALAAAGFSLGEYYEARGFGS
ncbi:MAG: AAA family ATPase [Planctomycetes bacterium]|nr:AAA family ATPase [Planctomycetota bacterium]